MLASQLCAGVSHGVENEILHCFRCPVAVRLPARYTPPQTTQKESALDVRPAGVAAGLYHRPARGAAREPQAYNPRVSAPPGHEEENRAGAATRAGW